MEYTTIEIHSMERGQFFQNPQMIIKEHTIASRHPIQVRFWYPRHYLKLQAQGAVAVRYSRLIPVV